MSADRRAASELQARLRSGQFVVTAEITPPVSIDPAEFLRRALVLSEGSPIVLVREPLSALLLAVAAVLLASVLLPTIARKRAETFVSEG